MASIRNNQLLTENKLFVSLCNEWAFKSPNSFLKILLRQSKLQLAYCPSETAGGKNVRKKTAGEFEHLFSYGFKSSQRKIIHKLCFERAVLCSTLNVVLKCSISVVPRLWA